MKRFFFWLWVTTLAALNWAALHEWDQTWVRCEAEQSKLILSLVEWPFELGK